MYTLYYSPGTASLVIHLALLEIGEPYRLESVDFDKGEQKSAAFLKLNPYGRVPTLLIDGKPYFESSALLATLADRHPESKLAPAAGTEARATWNQWVAFMATALGGPFRFWFYPQDLGATEHPPAVREALRQRIEEAWSVVDAHLAAHGPYVLGGQCSGADLLALMYMRWSRNMPRPALEWPALRRFAGLMRARPSWARLCELEGLTEWRS